MEAVRRRPADGGGPGEGREAILEAALALFGARGLEAVPVSQVARAAGVSKANVFHHFGSKEGLYREALREACRRTAAYLGEALAVPGLPGRLRALAQGQLGAMLAEEASARLLLREVLEGGPQGGRRLAEECFGRRWAAVVASFREAREAGELAPHADPALLATVLVAADVFYFLARHVLAHLPEEAGLAGDPQAYAEGVARLLLEGAGGPREGGGHGGEG